MHKQVKDVITHEELLFTTAVAIGRAMAAKDAVKAADASELLAEIVTEEDLNKTKAILKRSMTTCGCETCLEMLAKIAASEAKQEGESFAV